MKKLHKVAIATCSLLSLAPLTCAADDGLYLGASIGSASLSEDFDGFDVDSSSTAYRLQVGWQLNEYFSVEGGYQNFGRFEQSFDVSGEILDISLKADGFTLGATGSVPLSENFSLLGRAGAFFWDGDADINGVSQAKPEDTNLYIGVGAKFALTERVSLIGDWTRFELEDTQSNVVSLGLLVHF